MLRRNTYSLYFSLATGMGTLNAIYVRASDPQTIAALLAKYPVAYTEANTDYYAVDQPASRFECPEAELCDLSAGLRTDVIWLTFQSVVDAFAFHHWRDGKHLRSLVYGCFEQERTWERVEGSVEPWERGALFDPGHLAIALEFTKGPEERRALERIYGEAVLAVGQTEPSLDGRECAWKVAEHFRLPGWCLADEVAG
jgi:hypothetical protein